MKLKIVYLAFILSGISFGQNQIMIPYVKNSKWGFSDIDKKILIAPQYDSVCFFERTIVNQKKISYAFAFLNKRVGIIDSQNKRLLPIQYLDLVRIYESDFFIAKNEQNKFGLISLTSVALPFEYELIRSIMNNSFLVKKNNKIGVVDFQGKIVIPVIYDQINFIDEDEEKQTCQWRVSNEKITEYVYTPIQENMDDSYSLGDVESIQAIEDRVSKNKKQPKDYDVKIPIDNEDYSFITRKDNLYGFLNEEYNVGFLPKFEKLDFLTTYFDRNNKSNYFLTFKENNKKGLVSQTGATLLPAKYDRIQSRYKFIEIISDEKKGIYFISSNRFVEPKFTTLEDYTELNEAFIVVLVSEDNKNYYYIGENGNAFME
jgi:hypothetical protein